MRNTNKQTSKKETTTPKYISTIRPFTTKAKKVEITPFDDLHLMTETSNKEIKTYKGPVDISCTCLKEPKKIKEDIAKMLTLGKVSYKTSSVIFLI
jgi:hypothetical protein